MQLRTLRRYNGVSLASGRFSYPLDKVGYCDFERFRDTHEGIHRNCLFHALNLADIFGVQIGQFAKPLLGHLRVFAMVTNGLGKLFAMRKTLCHIGQGSRNEQI